MQNHYLCNCNYVGAFFCYFFPHSNLLHLSIDFTSVCILRIYLDQTDDRKRAKRKSKMKMLYS